MQKDSLNTLGRKYTYPRSEMLRLQWIMARKHKKKMGSVGPLEEPTEGLLAHLGEEVHLHEVRHAPITIVHAQEAQEKDGLCATNGHEMQGHEALVHVQCHLREVRHAPVAVVHAQGAHGCARGRARVHTSAVLAAVH